MTSRRDFIALSGGAALMAGCRLLSIHAQLEKMPKTKYMVKSVI